MHELRSALCRALLLLPAAPSLAAPLAPIFAVDPGWQPQLPHGWTFGNVAKIVIDTHDNVWILHRPRTVPVGKAAAPPVVEVDNSGKFLRGWGGDAPGYDWPDAEHNIFVDSHDDVYITGSSPSGQSRTLNSDDMIVKFSADGKFLRQFGGRSKVTGSKDRNAVNKPGDIFVWARTGELFVADGYGNRRVLVLDAATLVFRRMWGAFGKPPTDDAGSGGFGPTGGPGPGQARPAPDAPPIPVILDSEGPGPDRFMGSVHGIMVSNDGIVYVADRSARRVQTFTPEGKYLDELFVNRAGPSQDTVGGIAFSAEPEQKYMYLSDFGNSHIVVVERKTLKILYQFGGRGAEPGKFQGLHHIAVDSRGNLYTAEVAPGARAQKFLFKGVLPIAPSQAPNTGN